MKDHRVGSTCKLVALIALFMIGTIMMAYSTSSAAQTGAKKKKQPWTAMEAEIARQATEGTPLNEIINSSVQLNNRISDVVSAAIKVGLDPARVVYTAIAEGYSALTVVKTARNAGVPVSGILKAVNYADADKKSVYSGEIVTALITIGVDPSQVITNAITEGYPARIVTGKALSAGVSLPIVVNSAGYAGADKKSIYEGVADAGKSPAEAERLLTGKGASGPPVIVSSPSLVEARPALPPAPIPVLFGRGGIVLSPEPSWALPSFPADPFPVKINPFLSIAETFSDNVAFVPSALKESDSLTTITPGVRMRFPFQSHVAEAELYGVINRYKTNTDLNVNDTHAGLSVDFRVTNPFRLRITDTFEHGHESLSSSLTGSQEVFRTNALALSAAYQFTENFRARFDYELSTWRFDTSEFRDRNENGITGAVYYQVLPKTSLFVEYGGRKISYSEDIYLLDNTTSALLAGVTWEISDRSRGTIKAGLARRNFSSDSRQAGTVKVGSVDVRHDFSDSTTIVLMADRTITEPRLPNIGYFITTGAYAELTQRIIDELTAAVRGGYVHDLYEVRTDRTTLAGAGLKYRPWNWFDVSLDYNLRARHSDDPAFKYTEHSTIITADFSL